MIQTATTGPEGLYQSQRAWDLRKTVFYFAYWCPFLQILEEQK
jgi:hypothetical protein